MGKKILLEHINVPGIEGYEVYRKNGGYRSVEKALKMTPADIVEEVKKSGLRGRGWFPYRDEMELHRQEIRTSALSRLQCR